MGATAAASNLTVVLSKAAVAARLCVSEREPPAHSADGVAKISGRTGTHKNMWT
jgi:hypothetical protein